MLKDSNLIDDSSGAARSWNVWPKVQSAATPTMWRVRFLAGGAPSVDLRFLPPAVEAALPGATVVRVVADLRWNL